MTTNNCQPWFLWAATMTVLIALAISQNWNGLIGAVLVSSMVWYAIVSRPISRRQ